jgi:phage terminase large subunit
VSEQTLYEPLPRQKEAHKVTAPNILFGGAAGGSKSHWLRWHLLKKCLKYPGLRALLLRRQFTELEQTHLLAIRTEVPGQLARYDSSRHRLVLPNTSILQFGHCNTDADFASYLSTEWGIIGVDEGTQFTPYQLTMLPSRLRTTIPGFQTQFCIASNPGGPGHLWLKSHFLEHSVDPAEHPDYKPEEWVYVPSRVQDNPYLTEGYVGRLKQLPEHARRAYLDGDWDVFEGQAFGEWRASHHIQRYDPPAGWRWWGGMDWGYNDHCAVYFLAAGPRDILCRHEIYLRKKAPYDVGYLVGQKAKPYPMEYIAYGVDMKQDRMGGPTILEEFQRGLMDANPTSPIPAISVNAGPGSRAAGKMLVHEHLKFEALADGTIPQWSGAKIRVHPECANLIRTLPALPIDPNNSEEIDKDADDHCYDALRYALMSESSEAERAGFQERPGGQASRLGSPASAEETPVAGRAGRRGGTDRGDADRWRVLTGIRYGGARPEEDA